MFFSKLGNNHSKHLLAYVSVFMINRFVWYAMTRVLFLTLTGIYGIYRMGAPTISHI